ncbi:hypothetical protein AMEX_G22082 [Astyanax mexicanus]|uniref:Uncharacterized protein n=1 Tax=Astyanax mexicanus TaxID=7994 RepID=A0A8T2L3P1_ASTMX|nr:hypothetical protein AMEX_G22082 [Astyanax mexicanus]
MEDADFDMGGMEMGDVEMDVDVEVDGVDEVYDVEEAEDEEETERPKFKRPKNARQVPQKRKIIPVKVKDYVCCSMLTMTFCNVLFLGTAAMKCSLRARQQGYRRNIAAAKRWGRYALVSSIVAVILTGILSILLIVICSRNQDRCTCIL